MTDDNPFMKNLIYNNIVIDAGGELCPAIKIHPFNSKYLLTSVIDNEWAKSYLDARFGTYVILKKGRDALYNALSSYHLQKDDLVTILTTSDNFYISGCVTREVDKICQWNREVTDKTKVIIFNHEFGYPRRYLKDIAEYGLPIIEDCAHTFYDEDPEIGKYSDFVIYSLPKAFPMQMGGILKINKRIHVEIQPDVEKYVLSNLSRHIDNIEEYKEKRLSNFSYLRERLRSIGVQPYFEDEKAVPGTFLFKWDEDIDYPKLKEFMYLNGVECSVFYGKNAFFIPVHQELSQSELDYMVNLIHFYKNNKKEL